jgi:phage-related minor tail protein
MFASGGIVTRPTLALIGEAGPEAVIPRDRGAASGGVSIGSIVINGNVDSHERIRELADAVVGVILSQTRTRRQMFA